MPRPTARVLALREILQRGGIHPAAELAAELGVDERTVRRYIAHLEDLDVRIESVRGRHGGYRLLVGERMSPLVLAEDEAAAIAIALATAGRSGTLPDGSAAERSAGKVRRSLPAPIAKRVADILQTTAFTDAERAGTDLPTRTLILVATAARARRALWFHYTARSGDESVRTLHPHGVVAHSGRWYATGHDPDRDELRSFRLDRMRGVALLPGGFAPAEGADPASTVLRALATAPWRHEVVVRVRGGVEEVARAFPAGLAVVDPDPRASIGEEWCVARLRAEQLDWVAGLLAGLNRPFAVEAPDALRTALRELAERLRRAADELG